MRKCAEAGFCWASVEKLGTALNADRSRTLVGKCVVAAYCWACLQKKGVAGHVCRSRLLRHVRRSSRSRVLLGRSAEAGC